MSMGESMEISKRKEEGIQEKLIVQLIDVEIKNISRCIPHILNRPYTDRIHGNLSRNSDLLHLFFPQYFWSGFPWLETKQI